MNQVYSIQIDALEDGWVIDVYDVLWGCRSLDGRQGYVILEEYRDGFYWPWFCEWANGNERSG